MRAAAQRGLSFVVPYEFTMQANCPGGTITLTTGQVSGFKKGQNAIWQAVAPAGSGDQLGV